MYHSSQPQPQNAYSHRSRGLAAPPSMYALICSLPIPSQTQFTSQLISLTPLDLQKAYADYDAGTISREDLITAQDKAAKDSVLKMAETGETLLTDGEQRASSFATYPIIDTLGGKGLASNLAADGQYFVSPSARIRG